jgi:hypothetical protein
VDYIPLGGAVDGLAPRYMLISEATRFHDPVEYAGIKSLRRNDITLRRNDITLRRNDMTRTVDHSRSDLKPVPVRNELKIKEASEPELRRVLATPFHVR